MNKSTTDQLVKTTEAYYDSSDADNFYHTIWGGEDIHVGIYQAPDEDIFDASHRTVHEMASHLNISKDTKVLDLGAGYGGAARYLARTYGCKVTCINLSETENKRNREKNKTTGLDDQVEVIYGNFEELPFEDQSFDIVWSEDAILHSGQKRNVFEEVVRVLKAKGTFIFTDPMQSDDCPDGVLTNILERIHLKELGAVRQYRAWATAMGLKEKVILEMPEQLVNHYSQVQARLRTHRHELEAVCSAAYIDRMENGLQYWIDGGNSGYLNWGILAFEKP